METKSLNEHEIVAFLQQNPEFFENHADLLAVMHVPSMHGKGAVSLAERQQVAQRDKIRQLERKYSDLLSIGVENDQTSNKVHQLTLGLLDAEDFSGLTQKLFHSLREDFNVPDVNIKLWASPIQDHLHAQAAFEPVNESLKAWILSLTAPYCGPRLDESFEFLFNDPSNAKSYAVIPLGKEKTIGFLVLASEDEQRFYAGMGTLFLQRLNELLTAALSRYVM